MDVRNYSERPFLLFENLDEAVRIVTAIGFNRSEDTVTVSQIGNASDMPFWASGNRCEPRSRIEGELGGHRKNQM